MGGAEMRGAEFAATEEEGRVLEIGGTGAPGGRTTLPAESLVTRPMVRCGAELTAGVLPSSQSEIFRPQIGFKSEKSRFCWMLLDGAIPRPNCTPTPKQFPKLNTQPWCSCSFRPTRRSGT